MSNKKLEGETAARDDDELRSPSDDVSEATCLGFNILKSARYINIIVGVTLIIFSILYVINIFGAVGDLLACPGRLILNLFMIVFGGVIMGSSFNMKCIKTNFKFQMTGVGKGCFNIFCGILV